MQESHPNNQRFDLPRIRTERYQLPYDSLPEVERMRTDLPVKAKQFAHLRVPIVPPSQRRIRHHRLENDWLD